jgi:hypothetical protein
LNILCITYFYAGTGHPDSQAVVGVHQKKGYLPPAILQSEIFAALLSQKKKELIFILILPS